MMTVRKALPSDGHSISAVAITTWTDTYALEGVNDIYSKYVLNRFTPGNVVALISEHHVYVAESDFGVCGFAVVSEKSDRLFEIETIYILPKLQGRGIGRKFIEVIRADLNGPFWLKCADDNSQALSFYRSLGFEETGVTWFELEGEKYRCLVFELTPDNSV